MAHRGSFTLVESCALVMFLTCTCLGRELQQSQSDDPAPRTGIVTDGMSRKHLRIWKSIVDIVMAKDKGGSYLHPTLHGLYRQAESCDHLIRIELSEEESFCTAGRFIIEKLDRKGARHVAKIRLNLDTIRKTYVAKKTRLANGLIPFAGLRATERYAEVLGHELAHAVGILLDQDYLRLYQELEREIAEYESLLKNPERMPEDLERQWNRIETILSEFEKPAKTAEAEIWCELKNAGRNSSK